MPQRTPEGKWRIYHRGTGQAIDRWPVDARGMLALGEFVGEVPDGLEPLPDVTPAQRGIVEGPGAPIVPGIEAERKSREGALKEGDIPAGAQRAEDVPAAEPMKAPTRSSKKKKG